MELKFLKASYSIDILLVVALYVVHAVIIAILMLINSGPASIIYVVICAVVNIATKTEQSDIRNWIARAVLGLFFMPFSLARRIRPYAWSIRTSNLLPKVEDADLQKMYSRLSPLYQETRRMYNDPQWKALDFDFIKLTKNGTAEIVWGCRTWGEAETLFELVAEERKERIKQVAASH